MALLFKCKTSEGYQFKVLAELLSNNLKEACFDVTKECISLCMFDNRRKTLVDMKLDSHNFLIYTCNFNTKISIGITLQHFSKMLKTIKKKDSLELFITMENPHDLNIRTIPKENTRVTTSIIKIQTLQNVQSDLPCGYSRPIVVSSPDFQKMCKELSSIGSKNINVNAHTFYIDFIADADDILKRHVCLGERDDSEIIYSGTFTTDQFTRINKLSGISNVLQIYPGDENLPILFKSTIGSLGVISMYIKSNELTSNEELLHDNSDLE